MELWELVARESIRDLVARYNANGDSGRFEPLMELFAPDAVMELSGEVFAGHERIRSIFTSTAENVSAAPPAPGAPRPHLRHSTATLQIDVESPTSARVALLLHRAHGARARSLGSVHRRVRGRRRALALYPPSGLHRRRHARRVGCVVTDSGVTFIDTLPKLSADAHVDEPHDLWFERMDAAMRDRAPRRIESDTDGGWSLVVNGDALGWNALSYDEAAANETARLDAVTPDVRLAMMRTDGINGEIVYPTIGLYAWNITDPQVGEATCRIYNDWILERLGGQPRIKLATMLPTWSVEMARAEIDARRAPRISRRVAAAAGWHAGVEPSPMGTVVGCDQ